MAFVVLATWKAKPGQAEHIRKVLATIAPPSRAEEKNLQFQAHVSSDEPGTFFIYEKYTDSSGYDDHKNTSVFKTYVLGEAIPNLEDRSILTMETLD